MRHDTIDLNKTELQNAKIHNLASAPASPTLGQIYYNTANNIYYIWNGSVWVDLCKQGTVTSVTANGPLASTGGVTPVISLNDSGVAAGTYTKVTVTAKGLVSAATTLSAADIPALTHDKISDFDAGVRTSTLNQMALPTTSLNVNNQRVINVANPVSDTDAANKWYVDATRQGLAYKTSCRVATTTNIVLSGLQTIDGVVLADGDRVLVKSQTDATQNGIYVASAAAWARATDADNSGLGAEVFAGMYTYVSEGTTNATSSWVLITTADVVLGTTALTFTQFSGAGQITAGAGMTKSGNILNVVGTVNRITVNADNIDIASTYVGQASITTLGTIVTGTWHGSVVEQAYGGTGISSYLQGDMIYATDGGDLVTLAGNSGTKKFLSMTSLAPLWDVIQNSDLPAGFTLKTYDGISISSSSNSFTLTKDSSTLTRAGAHSLTLTTTGPSSVTLPQTGTLLSTGALVTVAQGGTGANNATQARANLGATTKFTQLVGDGSATTFNITHNLNTMDVIVMIRDNAAPYELMLVDTFIVDANTLQIKFAVAPTLSQYKVIIIG